MTGIVTPEMIASQPVRFGVRSSRLSGGSDAAMSFVQALNARTSAQSSAQTAAQTAATNLMSTMALNSVAQIGSLPSDGVTPTIDFSAYMPTPVTPVTPTAPTWDVSDTSSSVAGMPYGDLIMSAGQKYGVDPALIAAVIQQESDFDPSCVSSAGAKGLMQLMDDTAAGLGVTDSFDPAQNIDGGTHFLKEMLDRFGGDLSLALAAYNAGPYAVEKYGGIPPYEETQAYVPRVLDYYRQFAGLS
jgi:soluble lytic murein transglycosylase-like protein